MLKTHVQRRGAIGVVVVNWKESEYGSKLPILDGDIDLVSAGSDDVSAGTKPLTDDGDCGALFLDEGGIPWYMHHVLGRSLSNTSHSVFCSVLYGKPPWILWWTYGRVRASGV
jgi:hypothetical protein